MSKINFKPTPGFILVDPLEKDIKSSRMAVPDVQDKPYKGTVMAIGGKMITQSGERLNSPVKVGDFILYSIQGIEEFKMEYKGDFRHRFIIVPFTRVFGVMKK